MKVKWARSAIADLAGINAHIAQDSSQYAQRVVDRITNRTKQIGRFHTLDNRSPNTLAMTYVR